MSVPVSGIIPAFNRRDTVARAIASAQSQHMAPREILVIDDASGDGTADVAEQAGATVIRLTENGGAARARNRGISAATQPWIAFLDSDDEWMPHHLSTLWPYTYSASLISGGRASAESGGPARRGLGLRWRSRRFDDPSELLFPDNPISLGATLVSREALADAGGFDESLRMSEDFDLWLRMVQRHPALVIPKPLYTYHLHPGQKTSNVRATRSAQIALLERYRSASWWNEARFQKRVALNQAEALIVDGEKSRAGKLVLTGLLRQPRAYLPIALVLARNSVESRL